MYFTEILLNTATIGEVNLTAIDCFLLNIVRREKHRIMRHYSAELNKPTHLQNTQPNLLTLTFPCHLKVNRDKLALINRPWKSKKGKGRRLPLVHSRCFPPLL